MKKLLFLGLVISKLTFSNAIPNKISNIDVQIYSLKKKEIVCSYNINKKFSMKTKILNKNKKIQKINYEIYDINYGMFWALDEADWNNKKIEILEEQNKDIIKIDDKKFELSEFDKNQTYIVKYKSDVVYGLDYEMAIKIIDSKNLKFEIFEEDYGVLEEMLQFLNRQRKCF